MADYSFDISNQKVTITMTSSVNISMTMGISTSDTSDERLWINVKLDSGVFKDISKSPPPVNFVFIGNGSALLGAFDQEYIRNFEITASPSIFYGGDVSIRMLNTRRLDMFNTFKVNLPSSPSEIKIFNGDNDGSLQSLSLSSLVEINTAKNISLSGVELITTNSDSKIALTANADLKQTSDKFTGIEIKNTKLQARNIILNGNGSYNHGINMSSTIISANTISITGSAILPYYGIIGGKYIGNVTINNNVYDICNLSSFSYVPDNISGNITGSLTMGGVLIVEITDTNQSILNVKEKIDISKASIKIIDKTKEQNNSEFTIIHSGTIEPFSAHPNMSTVYDTDGKSYVISYSSNNSVKLTRGNEIPTTYKYNKMDKHLTLTLGTSISIILSKENLTFSLSGGVFEKTEDSDVLPGSYDFKIFTISSNLVTGNFTINSYLPFEHFINFSGRDTYELSKFVINAGNCLILLKDGVKIKATDKINITTESNIKIEDSSTIESVQFLRGNMGVVLKAGGEKTSCANSSGIYLGKNNIIQANSTDVDDKISLIGNSGKNGGSGVIINSGLIINGVINDDGDNISDGSGYVEIIGICSGDNSHVGVVTVSSVIIGKNTTIHGTSDYNTNGYNNHGIYITDSVISSGTGSLVLVGKGSGVGSFSSGVNITDGSKVMANNIMITGTSGDELKNDLSIGENHGINVEGKSNVLGDADIILHGTGSIDKLGSNGINIKDNSQIISNEGKIEFIGKTRSKLSNGVSIGGEITGKTNVKVIGYGSNIQDSVGYNSGGVFIQYPGIITSNDGSVVVEGHAYEINSAGVVILDKGKIVATKNGSVYVRGYSSGLTEIGNSAVIIHTGGQIVTTENATINVVGDARVDIAETENNTTGSNSYGVWIKGKSSGIYSANGSIRVDGTGGGKSFTNIGVIIEDGGRITSNNTGNIAVTGNGVNRKQ